MQTVTIKIPSALRTKTGGAAEIHAEGATVAQALHFLQEKHVDLYGSITTAEGEMRRFVNLYVGGRNVKSLDGLNTILNQGDTLTLVQAMVGG